jgi:hypothetical protein
MIGVKLILNYLLPVYGIYYICQILTKPSITLKPPFKVSLGNSGFEDKTEENLEWGKFSTEITDFGSLT